MVSFSEAVKSCLTRNFFSTSGRATRAEYWWFHLFIWTTAMGLMMIGAALEKKGGEFFMILGGIFFFITLIPSFCCRIRRMHDVGHSGMFILWGIVPYIGGIIVLIAELSGSDPDNEYGPNPFAQKHNEELISDNSTNSTETNNDNTEITDVDL